MSVSLHFHFGKKEKKKGKNNLYKREKKERSARSHLISGKKEGATVYLSKKKSSKGGRGGNYFV